MEAPKYFNMLADYLANQTEQELENRLDELNDYKSELELEMNCIKYQKYLNAKNESELNSFETENC